MRGSGWVDPTKQLGNVFPELCVRGWGVGGIPFGNIARNLVEGYPVEPTLFIIKELRNKVSSSVGRGHHQHQLFSNNCVEMGKGYFLFSFFLFPRTGHAKTETALNQNLCPLLSVSFSLAKRRPIVPNCTTYDSTSPLAPNSSSFSSFSSFFSSFSSFFSFSSFSSPIVLFST